MTNFVWAMLMIAVCASSLIVTCSMHKALIDRFNRKR